ncbi:hypothetical protein FQR65_LT00058 [Abscondita terminalis]|nr:hypothetical protein FQR65_LT00058 [Abscondita terminalis]
MNPTYQQYKNAYPALLDSDTPCASNGYGWHGNGYGWQLDPLKWTCPSSYTENTETVEEPVLASKKVEGSMAWYERLLESQGCLRNSIKIKFVKFIAFNDNNPLKFNYVTVKEAVQRNRYFKARDMQHTIHS